MNRIQKWIMGRWLLAILWPELSNAAKTRKYTILDYPIDETHDLKVNEVKNAILTMIRYIEFGVERNREW